MFLLTARIANVEIMSEITSDIHLLLRTSVKIRVQLSSDITFDGLQQTMHVRIEICSGNIWHSMAFLCHHFSFNGLHKLDFHWLEKRDKSFRTLDIPFRIVHWISVFEPTEFGHNEHRMQSLQLQ